LIETLTRSKLGTAKEQKCPAMRNDRRWSGDSVACKGEHERVLDMIRDLENERDPSPSHERQLQE